MDRYLMIAQDGNDEIISNKSRFICHIKRVYHDQDALQFIKEIKKHYCNASHNCSAYQIGDYNEVQKANDDGEPSGTAGVPILEVLRKQNIKNCVVVVTRYFGGVKLGTGGLIQTYGSVVSKTIKTLGVIERKPVRNLIVYADYSLLGTLKTQLKNNNYLLKNIHYDDKVTLEITVGIEAQKLFTEWITNLTNGKVTIDVGELSYQEIPYLKED